MSTPSREPGGRLPPIGELFSETLKDLMDNLGGYALASLGILAIAFPAGMIGATVAIVGMQVVGGVGFLASTGIAGAVDDPDVGGAIGLVGILASGLFAFATLFGVLAVAITLVGPFSASLTRSIAAHQRGEATLSFDAAFRTAKEAPFSSMAVLGITTAASFLGVMFCYVGALVPATLFSFAPAMVALHKKGAFDALSRCARHALAHPVDHFLLAVVYFATAVVAGQIPVFGHAFVLAMSVRAYRKLFGDGPEPAT